MEQQPLIPEVLEERSDAPNNGNGRPRGARKIKYQALERAVRAEILPILQKLIAQAKAGDTYAARLILDRVWPKPRTAALSIELPETRNPAELREAMHRILNQVAAGEIAPDEGAAFMTIIRDVLEAHRIQTFDPVSSAEMQGPNARELLATRLARMIEERNRRALPAPAEAES